MVSSIVPPIPVIDDYIDRFEDAWNDGEPRDLSSFLPIDGDAHRLSVLTEVVRVDLERRWTTDSHRSLDSYLEEFPELRSDADALGQVAYEEYRLRLRGEEAILPDAYARRYGVDISDWPRTTADTHHFASWHESTVNILQQESKRLVEAIEAYPAVGSDFLGFHLREKLGEGKFSRVYLAQQGALADRLVVLKLSTELWSESQRLARLQHTHIVPIYSVHHCGKMQALCMPFLGRQTLADAFRAEDAATPWQPIQRLTQLGVACRPHRCRHKVTGPDDGPTTLADQERACCRFVARLADGVAHAHARGIVHRDLKPANVLITDDGEPMLLDFNLSDDVVVGGRSSLMVGGTLPYMAPEQLSAVMTGSRLDNRCDIFALGVVLCQLLTGELPFPVYGGSFMDAVSRMIEDRSQQRWQRLFAGSLSVDLQSILGRCLAPSPEDRYASADELRDDLLRHQSDLPLAFAPNRSLTQRLAKWWRRHRQTVSVGTIALVGCVALGLLSLLGIWQQRRIQRLDAERFMASTLSDVKELRMGIGLPGVPWELRSDYGRRAQRVLESYGVTEGSIASDGWRRSPRLVRLDPASRRVVTSQLRQLAGRLAKDWEMQAAAGSPAGKATSWVAEFSRQSPASDGAVDEVAERLGNGEYQRAVELCEIQLNGRTADATQWHLYGVALAGVDRLSEAEDAFSRALALNPESPLSVFARGICRLQRRQYEPAALDFSRALDLYPGLEEAFYNRALVRQHQGRLEEALADWTRAITARPGWTRALRARAECRALIGDAEAAAEDREAVLVSTPRDEFDWVARGLTRLADDPDGALEDFEAARMCNPRSPDALQNIAHIYAEVKNEPAAAIAVLESYLRDFDAGSPMARAGIGVLQARQGMVQEAVASLESALWQSRSPQTCYQVACGFAVLGKDDPEFVPQAVALLRECLLQDLEWVHQAIEDPDLISLRENQDFRRLLAAASLLQAK